MAYPVVMPKLGLTMVEAELTEWLVPNGAYVAEGDVLFHLTTEKTETDAYAEDSGVLRQVVANGVTVDAMTVVGFLLTADEAGAS
jgi:pyruvate/2-oxoglutarate dehydrogenase complex dihydrolipoamide acyltransferase (E2) component